MKSGPCLKRIISLSLIISFTITNHFLVPTVLMAAPVATSTPANSFSEILKIKIPEELGKVDEVFQGENPETVILIQDAHSIPDAQRNIERIIEYFQKEYGVGLVGLEGAASGLDPLIFKSFPEKEKLKKVFEEYYDKGELTGSAAAAIFSKEKSEYRGVEDWKLYEEGLALYLAALKREGKLLGELEGKENGLQKEKEGVYSKELLEIDKLVGEFEANRVDLLKMLKRLGEVKAPEKGSELELLWEESKKDGKAQNDGVELEVKKIATQVQEYLKAKASGKAAFEDLRQFNVKYQAFKTSEITADSFALFMKELVVKYRLPMKVSWDLGQMMRKQKRMKDIEGTKLFKDLEAYAQGVKESLMTSEAQRKLDLESRKQRVMKKLIKLELSRKEWEEIKASPSHPSSLSPFQGVDSESFKFHRMFYENAEKRDGAFSERITKLMKELGKKEAMLVAGGFHAEGLTERLKEKGISYILVMPGMNHVPEETNYRSQMRGEVSWKDYFEVEEGKINLYKAFVRGTRDRLLKNENANRGQLLKQWRDQIIRELAEKEEITKASEYTGFMDEASGKQDQTKKLEKVEKFIEGLRKLEATGQLSEQNILKLLQPASIPPVADSGTTLTPGIGVDTTVTIGGERLSVMAAEPSLAITEKQAEMAAPEEVGARNELRSDQMEEKIKQHTGELQNYGLRGLEGRILRGLDPAGMLAVKETRVLIEKIAAEMNVSMNDLDDVTRKLHVGAVWEYADRLKKAEEPVILLWLYLAKTTQETNSGDLSQGEYLKDVERIKSDFEKQSSEVPGIAKAFASEASNHFTLDESGIPFSAEDAFLFMSMAGYKAGVVQSDKLFFVGSSQIPHAEVAQSQGLKPIEKEDRGRKNLFYQDDTGKDVIKVLYPGFLIVFGDKNLALQLAKAAIATPDRAELRAEKKTEGEKKPLIPVVVSRRIVLRTIFLGVVTGTVFTASKPTKDWVFDVKSDIPQPVDLKKEWQGRIDFVDQTKDKLLNDTEISFALNRVLGSLTNPMIRKADRLEAIKMIRLQDKPEIEGEAALSISWSSPAGMETSSVRLGDSKEADLKKMQDKFFEESYEKYRESAKLLPTFGRAIAVGIGAVAALFTSALVLLRTEVKLEDKKKEEALRTAGPGPLEYKGRSGGAGRAELRQAAPLSAKDEKIISDLTPYLQAFDNKKTLEMLRVYLQAGDYSRLAVFISLTLNERKKAGGLLGKFRSLVSMPTKDVVALQTVYDAVSEREDSDAVKDLRRMINALGISKDARGNFQIVTPKVADSLISEMMLKVRELYENGKIPFYYGRLILGDALAPIFNLKTAAKEAGLSDEEQEYRKISQRLSQEIDQYGYDTSIRAELRITTVQAGNLSADEIRNGLRAFVEGKEDSAWVLINENKTVGIYLTDRPGGVYGRSVFIQTPEGREKIAADNLDHKAMVELAIRAVEIFREAGKDPGKRLNEVVENLRSERSQKTSQMTVLNKGLDALASGILADISIQHKNEPDSQKKEALFNESSIRNRVASRVAEILSLDARTRELMARNDEFFKASLQEDVLNALSQNRQLYESALTAYFVKNLRVLVEETQRRNVGTPLSVPWESISRFGSEADVWINQGRSELRNEQLEEGGAFDLHEGDKFIGDGESQTILQTGDNLGFSGVTLNQKGETEYFMQFSYRDKKIYLEQAVANGKIQYKKADEAQAEAVQEAQSLIQDAEYAGLGFNMLTVSQVKDALAMLKSLSQEIQNLIQSQDLAALREVMRGDERDDSNRRRAYLQRLKNHPYSILYEKIKALITEKSKSFGNNVVRNQPLNLSEYILADGINRVVRAAVGLRGESRAELRAIDRQVFQAIMEQSLAGQDAEIASAVRQLAGVFFEKGMSQNSASLASIAYYDGFESLRPFNLSAIDVEGLNAMRTVLDGIKPRAQARRYQEAKINRIANAFSALFSQYQNRNAVPEVPKVKSRDEMIRDFAAGIEKWRVDEDRQFDSILAAWIAWTKAPDAWLSANGKTGQINSYTKSNLGEIGIRLNRLRSTKKQMIALLDVYVKKGASATPDDFEVLFTAWDQTRDAANQTLQFIADSNDTDKARRGLIANIDQNFGRYPGRLENFVSIVRSINFEDARILNSELLGDSTRAELRAEVPQDLRDLVKALEDAIMPGTSQKQRAQSRQAAGEILRPNPSQAEKLSALLDRGDTFSREDTKQLKAALSETIQTWLPNLDLGRAELRAYLNRVEANAALLNDAAGKPINAAVRVRKEIDELILQIGLIAGRNRFDDLAEALENIQSPREAMEAFLALNRKGQKRGFDQPQLKPYFFQLVSRIWLTREAQERDPAAREALMRYIASAQIKPIDRKYISQLVTKSLGGDRTALGEFEKHAYDAKNLISGEMVKSVLSELAPGEGKDPIRRESAYSLMKIMYSSGVTAVLKQNILTDFLLSANDFYTPNDERVSQMDGRFYLADYGLTEIVEVLGNAIRHEPSLNNETNTKFAERHREGINALFEKYPDLKEFHVFTVEMAYRDLARDIEASQQGRAELRGINVVPTGASANVPNKPDRQVLLNWQKEDPQAVLDAMGRLSEYLKSKFDSLEGWNGSTPFVKNLAQNISKNISDFIQSLKENKKTPLTAQTLSTLVRRYYEYTGLLTGLLHSQSWLSPTYSASTYQNRGLYQDYETRGMYERDGMISSEIEREFRANGYLSNRLASHVVFRNSNYAFYSLIIRLLKSQGQLSILVSASLEPDKRGMLERLAAASGKIKIQEVNLMRGGDAIQAALKNKANLLVFTSEDYARESENLTQLVASTKIRDVVVNSSSPLEWKKDWLQMFEVKDGVNNVQDFRYLYGVYEMRRISPATPIAHNADDAMVEIDGKDSKLAENLRESRVFGGFIDSYTFWNQSLIYTALDESEKVKSVAPPKITTFTFGNREKNLKEMTRHYEKVKRQFAAFPERAAVTDPYLKNYLQVAGDQIKKTLDELETMRARAPPDNQWTLEESQKMMAFEEDYRALLKFYTYLWTAVTKDTSKLRAKIESQIEKNLAALDEPTFDRDGKSLPQQHFLVQSGMGAVRTILETISQSTSRASILVGNNVYYEIEDLVKEKDWFVPVARQDEKNTDEIIRKIAPEGKVASGKYSSFFLDPIANALQTKTHEARRYQRDYPAFDFKELFSRLSAVEYPEPFFVVIDTSMLGPEFQLADYLKDIKVPANLHFVQFTSLQKLYENGLEMSTGGSISLVSHDKKENDTVAAKMRAAINDMGALQGLRGVLNLKASGFGREMKSRIQRIQKNALEFSQFVSDLFEKQYPGVPKLEVIYPGLKNHPEHEIAKRNYRSFGPFFFLRVGDRYENSDFIRRFSEKLKSRGIISFERDSYGFNHLSFTFYYPDLDDNAVRISMGPEDEIQMEQIKEAFEESLKEFLIAKGKISPTTGSLRSELRNVGDSPDTLPPVIKAEARSELRAAGDEGVVNRRKFLRIASQAPLSVQGLINAVTQAIVDIPIQKGFKDLVDFAASEHLDGNLGPGFDSIDRLRTRVGYWGGFGTKENPDFHVGSREALDAQQAELLGAAVSVQNKIQTIVKNRSTELIVLARELAAGNPDTVKRETERLRDGKSLSERVLRFFAKTDEEHRRSGKLEERNAVRERVEGNARAQLQQWAAFETLPQDKQLLVLRQVVDESLKKNKEYLFRALKQVRLIRTEMIKVAAVFKKIRARFPAEGKAGEGKKEVPGEKGPTPDELELRNGIIQLQINQLKFLREGMRSSIEARFDGISRDPIELDAIDMQIEQLEKTLQSSTVVRSELRLVANEVVNILLKGEGNAEAVVGKVEQNVKTVGLEQVAEALRAAAKAQVVETEAGTSYLSRQQANLGIDFFIEALLAAKIDGMMAIAFDIPGEEKNIQEAFKKGDLKSLFMLTLFTKRMKMESVKIDGLNKQIVVKIGARPISAATNGSVLPALTDAAGAEELLKSTNAFGVSRQRESGKAGDPNLDVVAAIGEMAGGILFSMNADGKVGNLRKQATAEEIKKKVLAALFKGKLIDPQYQNLFQIKNGTVSLNDAVLYKLVTEYLAKEAAAKAA